MVIRSNTSASSWEPFRLSIVALAPVFFQNKELVKKHAALLAMLQLDIKPIPSGSIVLAFPCQIHWGVFDEDGTMQRMKARMYVDDALLVASGTNFMRRLLAAVIETIFVVMGKPEMHLHQWPLAMDKWLKMVISHSQIMLGLKIDTRKLTVGVPAKYLFECRNLLEKGWPYNRPTFTVSNANRLVGKLQRLAKGVPWVYHLISGDVHHLWADRFTPTSVLVKVKQQTL